MMDVVILNNYRLDSRDLFAQLASPLLVERAQPYEGDYVLWDPEDDENGYLIVGSNKADLTDEFMDHFGDDIAYPQVSPQETKA